MARPKKDSRCLNTHIDSSVYMAMTEVCDMLGQTKTLAVERALADYAKKNLPPDKLAKYDFASDAVTN